MRKSHLIIAALIIGMMASVSSCKKKTVDPEPEPTTPTTQSVEKTEPTEDQLAVKIEQETVVFGEAPADDNYAQAVKNRIVNGVGAYNHETTNVVVIFASVSNTFTEQDYHDIYDCYKKGGVVTVVNPSLENFVNTFRVILREKAFNREVLQNNTLGITREQWMKHAGKRLLQISEQDSLTIEKGSLKSIGFHKGTNYVFKNVSEDEGGVVFSKYHGGIMADGIAEWIDDNLEAEKRDFSTTFGRGNELSSLSDAQIKTDETYSNVLQMNNGLYYTGYAGTTQNILTVYAAHDISLNRDWYQIEQRITFRNGYVNPVPDENNHYCWWNYHNIYLYFNALSYFKTNLGLTINGTKTIYDSHPQSANGSYQSSSSTSNGTTQSVTNGGTFGMSFGFTGLKLSANFSGSFSHSVTHGTSFTSTVGTSMTINDMSVTKKTVGSNMNWHYKFAEPYMNGTHPVDNVSWWAAPLSITDCTQQNTMLYYVDNPSGNATVTCNNEWNYPLYITYPYQSLLQWGTDAVNQQAVTFALKQPVRCYEEFTLQCIEYGDIEGNVSMIDMFNANTDSWIINGVYSSNVGGSSADDILVTANELLEQFITEFAAKSISYKALGCTGTFTWELGSKTSDMVVTKNYTIQ